MVSANEDYIHLNSSSADDDCLTASKDASHFSLYLSPECVYSVSVGLGLSDILHSLARTLPTVVPANVVSVSIILTAATIASPNKNVLETLTTLSPIPAIMGSRLLVYTLSLGNISSDVGALTNLGLNFGVSPLLIFLLGHALSFIPLSVLVGLVTMAGHLMIRMSPNRDIAETIIFSKYPPAVSLMLICLSLATCSCVGLLLGFILYIVHISLLYKDRLITQNPRSLSSISCHLCLALLWGLQLSLGLPSLMTWSLSPASASVTSDTGLIHTICLLGSASLLWQRNPEILTIDEKYNDGLYYGLYFLAVLILPFATVSVYRIGFAISSIFVCISSLILVSMDWNKPSTDNIPEEETTTTARHESAPVKKKGTYKIINSYLETGEEPLIF